VKALLILTLALTALLSACATPTATPEPTPAPREGVPGPTLFGTDWRDPEPFLAGLIAPQAEALGALPTATVYHLAFDLSDDLTVVHGIEEVLYTNTEAQPLDQIALHLYPNLLGGEIAITSTRLNGAEVTPSYGEGEGSMMVPLGSGLAPGDSVVLRLEFSVRVPQELELNYGVLASTNGVLAYAHGYPMVAVYDSDGWNVDIPAPYGDITYADSSFYLVRVRAPADVVLCGSGTDVARTEVDGRQEVTLAVGPARDFYLAASREYRVAERQTGGIVLRVCSRTGTQDKAERTLDIAALSLDMFGELYAPYPYTKLDIVTIPTSAGGIEYPAAFALNELLYTPGEDFEGRSEEVLLEAVTVHEVAHEWFYNVVGNDQLHDPWLDEAVAQYALLRYFGDQHGDEGASGMRGSFYGRWDRVDREPIPLGMPVAAYDDTAYSAIVYGRGPLFIETLERHMGQSTFDAFLKAYTETFSWEEATPEDFQRVAEAECDCDLDGLFSEWVYVSP